MPLKNNVTNSSKTHHTEEEENIEDQDITEVHITGDLFRVREAEDNIGQLVQQD